MLIREKDRELIVSLAQKTLNHPSRVWAYGSCVSGEAHDTSDLDLVIVSNDGKKVDIGEFINFKEALQNSNIPILMQVLDWNRIPESFHANILANYEEMVDIG